VALCEINSVTSVVKKFCASAFLWLKDLLSLTKCRQALKKIPGKKPGTSILR
jgi:hypothetical protein